MSEILTYKQAKEALSLREKVGQFFMPAVFINDSEEEIQKIENLIKIHGIGSICFFHSRASAATNYEGKKEVIYNAKSLDKLKQLIARYQAASKYPLLIAIDAEWGLAMRVEETPQYPYALTLGAITDTKLIEKVGEHIGHDCHEAGIHWNLCPAVDINNNADNPVIGYRSFGDRPEQVYQKSKAFVKGMNKSGVLNSIKHFPGHGDTAVDSHLGLPRIDKSKEELFKNELYPFKKLISDDGIDSVMVGHLAVPAISKSETRSSTLSKPIVTGLIREEFGHLGVIITDALNMHSVSKLYDVKGQLEWEAFEAGNEVLCFAENTAEGIELILKNAMEQRIEESFQRVWKLKEKAFKISDQDLGYSYSNLMKTLAEKTLTLIKGNENEIKQVRQSGFRLLEIGKNEASLFCKNIYNTLDTSNNTVIALFPPEMKPTNHFGINANEVAEINTLLNTSNCVLYVFGNPYTLHLFNWEQANTIIVAYQDFEVFQENAAKHFNGEITAQGSLPVTLKRNPNE